MNRHRWRRWRRETFVQPLKLLLGRLRGRQFPGRKTVFIIGQNKTGTTSVAQAFRDLGTNHLTIMRTPGLLFHQRDWEGLARLASRYDSLDDQPWNQEEVVARMHAAFGDRAVFVLNTRAPQAWFDSYVRFRHHSGKPLQLQPGESETDFIKRQLLDRNQRIRDLFAAHPERLFEGDITDPDFMERLRAATGYPELGALPHVNQTPRPGQS